MPQPPRALCRRKRPQTASPTGCSPPQVRAPLCCVGNSLPLPPNRSVMCVCSIQRRCGRRGPSCVHRHREGASRGGVSPGGRRQKLRSRDGSGAKQNGSADVRGLVPLPRGPLTAHNSGGCAAARSRGAHFTAVCRRVRRRSSGGHGSGSRETAAEGAPWRALLGVWGLPIEGVVAGTHACVHPVPYDGAHGGGSAGGAQAQPP